MKKCCVTVKQGDVELKTVKLPKANPAEMIQFVVPAEKIKADEKIEVSVYER